MTSIDRIYELVIDALKNERFYEAKKIINQSQVSEIQWLLWYVCYHDHFEFVKLLLDKGVNVQFRNNSAIYSVCHEGYYEIAKLLIERGADIHVDNDKPIRDACSKGYYEIAKMLIENGANIHAEDNHCMAFATDYKIVKLLIDHGADATARKSLALRTAACRGDIESMKLLIEHVADINTVNIPVVAQCNQLEAVKLLYEHGADIHVDNDFAIVKAWSGGLHEIEEFLRTH